MFTCILRLNMGTKIGFIGLGLMGKPMVMRLLSAGYSVTVNNRSQSSVSELVSKGAINASTPKEVALSSDVVITMLPDAPDVEKVILDKNGLIESDTSLTIIDMSTISYDSTLKISSKLAAKKIDFLDAPVSGGVIGAENGTLTIMVGGNENIFTEVLPIFNVLGSNTVLMGNVGSGQITKSCNQIIVSINLQGICEALTLAKKAGLNLDDLLKAIGGGAAKSWQLDNLAPKIINGDFKPGFKASHQNKDLKHTLSLANKINATLPTTALVQQFYSSLNSNGFGSEGTQSIIKILDMLS